MGFDNYFQRLIVLVTVFTYPYVLHIEDLEILQPYCKPQFRLSSPEKAISGTEDRNF